MRLSDRSKISTCVFQDPFLFPLAERETVLVLHLAANAIPGPVSRRPANGAAAEIACRLHLPPAASARNSKEKGNKGKRPLVPSGGAGNGMAFQVALKGKLVITPACGVQYKRNLPHVRPLARRVHNPLSAASVSEATREWRSVKGTPSLEAPFSFLHRARRCLSFRRIEKKDRGRKTRNICCMQPINKVVLLYTENTESCKRGQDHGPYRPHLPL